MQRVTLLVLTILALGLGAFVYFYEIRGKPEPGARNAKINILKMFVPETQ